MGKPGDVGGVMRVGELWGCVVVPQVAAQAGVRLRPGLAERPVVVMEGVRPLERVCGVSTRARQIGLHEGMTRVEVETFNEVTVLARSVEEERVAVAILLETMGRFTPRAEPKLTGPDWECCLDLAGTERLLGDEKTLAGKIVEALEKIGFLACVVMVGNVDAGFLLSRFLAWGLERLVSATRPAHHEKQERDEWGTGSVVVEGCGDLIARPTHPEGRVRDEWGTGGLVAEPTLGTERLSRRWGTKNHHERDRLQVRVVVAGGEAKALAPLPLMVLKLDGEAQERFGIWGISTLGELAALPETALIARMGQVGKQLRLRARGQLPHLLEPAEKAFRLEEVLELDESVETLEPLLFLLNPMLEQLIVRAQERALALASVTVELGIEVSADRMLGSDLSSEAVEPTSQNRDPSAGSGQAMGHPDNPVHTRTVRPAVAVLDRALLLKMLQLELEAHPSPGAVVKVRLWAESGDTSRIQLGLFAPQMPEPTRFEDTHARLVSLVGEGNVGRVKPLDTHAPEAFVLERFRLPEGGYKAPVVREVAARPATALRRMRPPVEVRVKMRGSQIAEFWFEARRFEVLRSYGPWRASGDWWCGSVWSADSWDVAAVNEGELMVCLVGRDLRAGIWRMEGVYD